MKQVMMEQLWNGMTIASDRSFPVGTDSMLLAQFLTLPRQAKIADFGSGCGTLGILLCAREGTCRVTGIELDEAAHNAALENISRNGLSGRLTSLHGDVRRIRELLPANSFDCVISNPPYFPPGSGKVSQTNAMARSEASLPLEDLCREAAYLLPTGGRFALVHRPERLCDLMFFLRTAGIEPKRIQFVRHRPGAPVCLVLLEGRRGGKPGLKYEPDFTEFHEDGTPTGEYRAVYHEGATL